MSHQSNTLPGGAARTGQRLLPCRGVGRGGACLGRLQPGCFVGSGVFERTLSPFPSDSSIASRGVKRGPVKWSQGVSSQSSLCLVISEQQIGQAGMAGMAGLSLSRWHGSQSMDSKPLTHRPAAERG